MQPCPPCFRLFVATLSCIQSQCVGDCTAAPMSMQMPKPTRRYRVRHGRAAAQQQCAGQAPAAGCTRVPARMACALLRGPAGALPGDQGRCTQPPSLSLSAFCLALMWWWCIHERHAASSHTVAPCMCMLTVYVDCGALAGCPVCPAPHENVKKHLESSWQHARHPQPTASARPRQSAAPNCTRFMHMHAALLRPLHTDPTVRTWTIMVVHTGRCVHGGHRVDCAERAAGQLPAHHGGVHHVVGVTTQVGVWGLHAVTRRHVTHVRLVWCCCCACWHAAHEAAHTCGKVPQVWARVLLCGVRVQLSRTSLASVGACGHLGSCEPAWRFLCCRSYLRRGFCGR